MTNWRKVYWRFINAVMSFGSGILAGKLAIFISPVFIVGVMVLGVSVVFLFPVGLGPCGPTSTWGWIWFFGVMLGLAVICLGLLLSAVRTLRYFWLRLRHKDGDGF